MTQTLTTALSSKGQLVIPLPIRDYLKLKPQMPLYIRVLSDSIIITAQQSVAKHGFGAFKDVGVSSKRLLQQARDEEDQLHTR